MANYNIKVAILPQGAGAAAVRAQLQGVASGAQAAHLQVSVLHDGLGRLKQAAAGLVGLASIGATLASVGRQAVAANIEAQNSAAQLTAALRSTGNAAGFTVEELGRLADAKSRQTGVDDELIQSAEAVLLRYNRIGRETFPRVVQAALDMSVKTGDLVSAMEQAGKIVNNPLRGLTLLERQGYAVGASQKDLIKHMLAVGDVAGAQAQMLAILERQYGGAAAAARDTLGGALRAVSTEWENFLERASADSTGPMRQAIEGVVTALRKLTASWSYLEIGVAGTTAAVLRLLAPVEDRVRQLGVLVAAVGGQPGEAVRRDTARTEAAARNRAAIESAERAQARALARLLLEQGKISEDLARKLGLLGKAHQSAGTAALEQTEAERKLGEASKHAIREAERRAETLAEMRNAAQAAAAAFRLVGATDKEILRNEIAQARLAAALKLGAGATRAQVAEAQRYATSATVATHAARNWEAALKDLREAQESRVQAQFEENVRQLGADRTPYELGTAIDPKVVEGIFQKIRDEARATADAIKAAGLTIVERYHLQKDTVERLVRLKELTAEEGARALADIERQRWDDTLAAADHALGYLADRFGGLFSYLQQAVNAIQGARSFGASVTQAAQGITGSTAGWTSTLGAAAGVLSFYYELYRMASDFIKAKKLKRFGSSASFELSGGTELHSFFKGQEREIVGAIRSLVRNLEEALGVLVTDLEEIGIKVRNDGKKARAYVHGVFVGEFNDVQEAIAAALQVALRDGDTQIRGLTDLMRQGLQRVKLPDLEEMTRFLGQLREIGDLGLPQGAVQVREAVRHLEQLWLALGRLREATPAVIEGFQNLIRAESTTWTQWRRNITGEQETPAEQLARLQAEARIFNAEKALRILELQARREQLRQEIEQARIRIDLGGVGGRIGRILLQHQQEELKVRASMVQVSKAITEAQVTLWEAQLQALEDLLAALAAIPDIKIPDLKLPRVGGGGAGGVDLGQMAADAMREVARRGMTEYGRGLDEITAKWAEATRGAKQGSRALEAANAARQAEIDLLNRETAQRTREGILGLILPPGVADILAGRRTFAEARDLPASARPGPLWQIDRWEQQWEGQQQAGLRGSIDAMMGVGASLASITAGANNLRAAVVALGLDADATAALLADLDIAAAFQTEQATVGVLDRLLAYGREAGKYTAELAALQERKVELDFALIKAQLVALGAWDEVIAKIHGDLLQYARRQADGGGAGAWREQAAQRLAERQEEAARLQAEAAEALRQVVQSLEETQRNLRLDERLSPLTPEQQFAEAQDTFRRLAQEALASRSVEAAQRVAQFAARDYATLARERFASSEQYQVIAQEIDTWLTLLRQRLSGQAENVLPFAGGAGAGTAAGVGGAAPAAPYAITVPVPAAVSGASETTLQRLLSVAEHMDARLRRLEERMAELEAVERDSARDLHMVASRIRA